MKRFKNILVVFDSATGDQHALDQAAELAQRNAASLGLVVCLKDFHSEDSADQLQHVIVKGLRDYFEQRVEPLRDQGLRVSVDVLIGRPFIQVIRHVASHAHDLVVKNAETVDHRGYRFASTDLHLLRKCPQPVWLIRNHQNQSKGPIVAAVSPSLGNDSTDSLNIKLLELASSFAKRRGQQLHVVQAWSRPDPLLLRYLGWRDDDPKLKDRLSERRDKAEAHFNALVRPFARAGLALRHQFVDGIASDVIVRTVKDVRAGLVVMSTVTRATVPGLLIGRTAEDVLRQIDCAVLAVKPDGFVSPVAA